MDDPLERSKTNLSAYSANNSVNESLCQSRLGNINAFKWFRMNSTNINYTFNISKYLSKQCDLMNFYLLFRNNGLKTRHYERKIQV